MIAARSDCSVSACGAVPGGSRSHTSVPGASKFAVSC